MPNIKSQAKRMRRSEKQRRRNKDVRSSLKTRISNFSEALEAKDKEVARKVLTTAISALDTAATKGIIHANNAANKKSKMMKKYSKLELARA